MRWPALFFWATFWLAYWTIEALDYAEYLFWDFVRELMQTTFGKVYLFVLILAFISILFGVADFMNRARDWYHTGRIYF